jgi:hypothetical protein
MTLVHHRDGSVTGLAKSAGMTINGTFDGTTLLFDQVTHDDGLGKKNTCIAQLSGTGINLVLSGTYQSSTPLSTSAGTFTCKKRDPAAESNATGRLFTLVFVLAVVFLPHLWPAGGDCSSYEKRYPRGGRPTEVWKIVFKQHDKDLNGILTNKEMDPTVIEGIEKADGNAGNDDGRLTVDEFADPFKAEYIAKTREFHQKVFDSLDRNGDKIVSKDEKNRA